MGAMLISELAQRCNTTVHALRHYEKCGLLLPTRRANGWRDYPATLQREVVFITMSRAIGFSLREIGEWLPAYRSHRLTLAQLAARVDTLIVTRGAEGSIVWQKGTEQTIAPVPATAVKDPTGCGDAYRAGLLLAMATGRSLLDGARLGSVLGSIKIAVQGCQNHRPTREEIRAQFEQHYGAWPF